MMRKEISDFLDIIILKIFSAKIDSFEFHDLDLGAKMYRQPIFFPGIFSTALFLWPQGFPEIPRNTL